jgi:sec-independent protein translocase protein TatA
MNALLFLEFLGTSELLVIAVVALLLFGPRKLPDISRTLGKSLAEFKRASDDFKRTWEYEVELERRKPALDAADEPRPAEGESPAQPSAVPGASAWGAGASGVTAEGLMNRAASAQQESQTVARASSDAWPERVAGDGADETAAGGVMSGGAASADEPEQGDIELNAS